MVTRTYTLNSLKGTLWALGGLCAACLPQAAAAQSVPAGSVIESTAQASYDDAGVSRTATSNTVQVRVDELLDVAATGLDAGPVTVRSGPAALRFAISNSGNGPEQFVLEAVSAVAGNGFDAGVDGIALDSNGNGTYEAGIDELLPAPAITASLAADTTRTVFVLLTIPAGTPDGAASQVNLIARAATGIGTPGTVFAGAGEGGGDAVAGLSGASAVATGQLIASASTVTLTKRASIADPFGGTAAVPGAIITYVIEARVNGSADIAGLVVTDAIPARTAYRANTLTLEGSALTDAPGDDAGEASAGGVRVELGNLPGGALRTISFSVLINEVNP